MVPEGRYVYRVRAINSAGMSRKSDYVNVPVPAAPEPEPEPEPEPKVVRADDITIQFEDTAYTVKEGENIQVWVIMSRAHTDTVHGSITTEYLGTATSDDIFTVLAPLIPPNQTRVAINVSAAEDEDIDPGETVRITMRDTGLPSGIVIGERNTVIVTIIDTTRTIQFEDTAYTVKEGETVQVWVIMSRAHTDIVHGTITTEYLGTATSDDISSVLAPLIPPSWTRVAINVSAAEDEDIDPGETVRFTMKDTGLPSGTVIGERNTVIVTIIDTTPPPASVNISSPIPREGSQLHAVLVDLDGPTGTTWQWSRGDCPTGTFTDIPGATGRTYTPNAGDAGMFLKATAVYDDSKGTGNTASGTSASIVISLENFTAYEDTIYRIQRVRYYIGYSESRQIGWNYPIPKPQLPVTNSQGQSRKAPASLDYYEVERSIRIPEGRWSPWTFYRNVMDDGILGDSQYTDIPGLPPCQEEQWRVRPVYKVKGHYVLTGMHTGPWTYLGT